MACKSFKKTATGWVESETSYVKDVTEWKSGEVQHKKITGWEKCEIIIPEDNAPTISDPQNAYVYTGGVATFEVTASQYDSLQWFKDDVLIPNAKSLIYTTPTLTLADTGGEYYCVATNDFSEAESAAATLTVTAISSPPGFTTHPQAQSIAVGGVGTFTVVVTGYTGLQWYRDGVLIDGAESDRYVTPILEFGDDALYLCTASNSDYTVDSNAAQLTVFEAECDPLTGDAAVFLTAPTSHTYFGAKPAGWNKTMEELPSNRVFPEGQKMFISAFDPTLSLIPAASAAGFTVMGPWRNTYNNIKSNWANSVIKDDDTIQITAYLRNMRAINNPGGTISVEWNNKDAAALYDIAKSEVDLYRADANLQGHKIHGWLYCLDDYGSELPDYGKLHEFMGYLNTYLGNESVGNAVKGGMFTNSSTYRNYLPEATQLMNQTYFDGGTCPMTGYDSHRSQLWWNWSGQLHSAEDAHYPSPAGVPRIRPIMPIVGLSWPSDSDIAAGKSVAWQRNNTEYMSRELQLCFLNAIMSGMNGITYYALQTNGQGQCGTSQTYRDNLRNNFLDFMTIITTHEVERALLWGKGAEPQIGDHTNTTTYRVEYNPVDHHGTEAISKARVSGAATYPCFVNPDLDSNNLPTGWGYNNLNIDPVTYRDIQYKGVRFVIVTNSTPDPEIYAGVNNCPDPGNNGVVVTDFSGFPTNGQIKITDILSDADHTTTSGTVRLTMQPNTAVILKVEPADGYCGGDEPQEAPAIQTHPQSGSYPVGTQPTPTLTVEYTPVNASVRWQWKNPTEQDVEMWVDVGDGTNSYQIKDNGSGLVAAQNDDRFRAIITTSGNTPLESNEAIITVT